MSDTVQKTSSARRLAAALHTVQQHTSHDLAIAWTIALGMENTVRYDGLRGIRAAIELIQEVRRDIIALPGIKHELYLKPIESLEAAIYSTPPSATYSEFWKKLDTRTVETLEFCADRLDMVSHEAELPHNVLTKLLGDVDALFKALATADLDPRFRALLLKRLDAVRHAIITYQLFGAEPLEAALDAALGALLASQGLATKPAARSRLKDLFQLIVSAQTAVKSSLELGAAIPDAVLKALGPGAPPA